MFFNHLEGLVFDIYVLEDCFDDPIGIGELAGVILDVAGSDSLGEFWADEIAVLNLTANATASNLIGIVIIRGTAV